MSERLIDVDVLIAGAGAAGLAAARASAGAGVRTIVLDAYERPGGQYFRQPALSSTAATRTQRRGQSLIGAARRAGAELWPNTTVWDITGDSAQVLRNGTLSTIRYCSLVVAAGAHERAAAFPGWTLPGVYTAGALQSLLKEHGVIPARTAVFAGSGPLQLVVAAALATRSASVAGVFEATSIGREGLSHPLMTMRGMWRQSARLREGLTAAAALARQSVPVRTGWGIVEATGTDFVVGAVVARLDRRWRPVAGTERHIDCDTISTHYSLVPSTELLRLLAVDMAHRPALGGWVPTCTDTMATTRSGVFAAGDCTGIGGVTMSLLEGEIAGAAAAAHATGARFEPSRKQRAAHVRERRFQQLYGSLFSPRDGLVELATASTPVCRCEDTPRDAVDAALARGATTLQMVKSLTRCGMGPCQGRICAPIVGQIVEHATGHAQPPLTARQPLNPLPMHALVEP